MRNKIMYTIIVFILSILMNVGIFAQGSSVGSWVVSSDYGDELGYMNYRLFFNTSGELTWEVLSSEESFSNHYEFAFSLGAYDTCSSNMETYITDTSHYIDGIPWRWAEEDNDSELGADIEIIPSYYGNSDYLMFYNGSNDEGSGVHYLGFFIVEIKNNDGVFSYTTTDFDFELDGNGPDSPVDVAFAITNNIDGERFLYTVANTHGANGLTGNYGLEKFAINNNGIEQVGTLLDDIDDNELENGFSAEDYNGYNLEMQNKDNVEEPIIAWITKPISTTTNDKIFVFDDGDHFVVELSEIGSGRIGGIEFSPFEGEEDYMFVSTENLGLIKIDWHDGTIVYQYTSSPNVDFTHTYVQTAPNGFVYAVSDDGTSFGEIRSNNTFNSTAFTYPVNNPASVSSHIDYYVCDPDGVNVKYYNLPENDTPLLPVYHDMLVIDSETSQNDPSLADMIWDSNDGFPDNTIMFEQGFKLTDGVTLTVNDMFLEFNPINMAKVVIDTGCKLVVNNSILTNHHCYDALKWAGVEVWGEKDSAQIQEHQGKLLMYGSTIEHAHEAVQLWKPDDYNKTGGMIYAENSQFLNNHRAISALSFKNMRFGGEFNYEASFNRCLFQNDEDYLDDNPFMTFVTLWAVKGIKFRACEFNSGGRNGTGIYSVNAGFSTSGICTGSPGSNGCTNWDSTKFYHFDKAISANNAGLQNTYPINIQHSYFYNNNFGAYLYNLQNVASVKTSKFIVGNNGETKEKSLCGSFWGRGIHIEASNGFTIENNVFSKNTEADLDDEVVGIHARENPSDHDIIYNNTFTNLKIGNQAFGNNRQDGTDPKGLEYQCNENTNNKIDFEVVGDLISNTKMRPNIGLTDISAHNKFTSTSFADLEWHWRNMGMEQENYYISSSELGSEYVPDRDNYVETTGDIATLFIIHNDVNTIENQCPDNDGIHEERLVLTSGEQQALEAEFAIAYNDYQSVKTIYNDLKDGGSTSGTNLTIAAAQPDDTWELKDNLIGKSPHLSKLVLIEAANKTDVLPNSVLLDILAANPDELKKEDFIQFLENKEEPLPNYMIEILRDLSTGATYKTVLVNQMAMHKRKQVLAANRIIKSLINEEEQDYTAIKNWLANKTTLLADMQISGILMNEGNYTNAIALLNLIPETYNLQDDALSHYLINKDYMLLEIDLKQSGRSYMELTSDELAQLEIWADGKKGMARSSSRTVLENFYGYDNYCDCMDRGENKSANADDAFEEQESPLSIKASPNPATHYVEFTYELSEIDNEGIIIITDINGKQIQSFTVKYSKGVRAWDTRKTPTGSYIYTLKTKYFEESGKLIVQ